MKKPPDELVATRPAFAEEQHVNHPATGEPLGLCPKGYTRGVHDRIVELIRRRNRPHVAAAVAGIPATTFHAWMRRGREGDPWLYEFSKDVEQAMAQAEASAVEAVTGNADDFGLDTENAKWWLERARGDGYSKEATTRVNAMLAEFFENLERALPPHIFQMVITAAQGQPLAQSKPVFQLTDGSEEEDDEPAG